MIVVDGVEVLDVREAAAYVSRTPETVRRWVWSGRLTAVRNGNRLLVRRADLDALSERRRPALSLRAWVDELPEADGLSTGSAADLVVDERERRARR